MLEGPTPASSKLLLDHHYISHFKTNFNNYEFILYSIFYIIAGVCRNNSDPIAGKHSTIPSRSKKSSLRPPLPSITHEQIACGELASLLEEDDYNLTTMVNLKPHIIQPDNYLFHILSLAVKNVSNKL